MLETRRNLAQGALGIEGVGSLAEVPRPVVTACLVVTLPMITLELEETVEWLLPVGHLSLSAQQRRHVHYDNHLNVSFPNAAGATLASISVEWRRIESRVRGARLREPRRAALRLALALDCPAKLVTALAATLIPPHPASSSSFPQNERPEDPNSFSLAIWPTSQDLRVFKRFSSPPCRLTRKRRASCWPSIHLPSNSRVVTLSSPFPLSC